MSQPASADTKPPEIDDRPLWDILFGVIGYQAVVVAHHIKLFPTLAAQPLSLEELCAALALSPRSAQALLSVSASVGLVRVVDGRYALTPVAETYLLESSPTYFGGFFDFSLIGNRVSHQFDGMKQTVLTNQNIIGGEYDFLQMQEMARQFTRAMHHHSVGASLYWSGLLELASTKTMLDVGGGSGVHTIGAVQRWPQLKAIVFDMATVCQVAEEFIAQAGLADRISTYAGDMWDAAPFPEADLHFYSEIYHNWPPEKCRFLTQKSFDSLLPGGRLVVHEMLMNEEKTGPFSSAAYSVAMLLWTFGQQYSGSELTSMLTEAGFVEVEVKPSFGYWSIVTGRKPE